MRNVWVQVCHILEPTMLLAPFSVAGAVTPSLPLYETDMEGGSSSRCRLLVPTEVGSCNCAEPSFAAPPAPFASCGAEVVKSGVATEVRHVVAVLVVAVQCGQVTLSPLSVCRSSSLGIVQRTAVVIPGTVHCVFAGGYVCTLGVSSVSMDGIAQPTFVALLTVANGAKNFF